MKLLCNTSYLLLMLAYLVTKGYCQFEVTVPNKKKYNINETFQFSCSGSLDQNQQVHFVKVDTTVKTYNGLTLVSWEENPLVLSTFGNTIDELPTRYSVEGTNNGNTFQYTFKITDLQPEDNGNFSCVIDDNYGNLVKIPVLVFGPINRLGFFYKASDIDKADVSSVPIVSKGDLTYSIEEPIGQLGVIIETTTASLSSWEVILEGGNRVTDQFGERFGGDNAITNIINSDAGLVTFVDPNYFFAESSTSSPFYDYKNLGKTLTLQAQAEGLDKSQVSVALNMEFVSPAVQCADKPYRLKGNDNIFLACCGVDSNPKGDLDWTVEGGIREGVQGDVFKLPESLSFVAILTFDEVKDEDYKEYTFKVENRLGFKSSTFQFTKESMKDVPLVDLDQIKAVPDTCKVSVNEASILMVNKFAIWILVFYYIV